MHHTAPEPKSITLFDISRFIKVASEVRDNTADHNSCKLIIVILQAGFWEAFQTTNNFVGGTSFTIGNATGDAVHYW